MKVDRIVHPDTWSKLTHAILTQTRYCRERLLPVGIWEIEFPPMKSDNPTSALVARWMTHTRNLFDDLDWLLTDSNVLDDFPRELDFPALRQRMEREFVADCSFYLISEDSYELTTIPKSATYHFGVEDDGRFFFDIQLFVNVLAPQMLTIGRQTGIDVERVEEVALLNHARLAAGLEQLAASGFQVTSMLSEQIDAGG